MSLGADTYVLLMYLRHGVYSQLNVSRCCYLCVHYISTPPKCQSPRVIKSTHRPSKISTPAHKYPQTH